MALTIYLQKTSDGPGPEAVIQVPITLKKKKNK